MREVIVCDHGSTDQTHSVAEHAGCHYVASGGVAAGIRQAKGDWLLLLEPGARLVEGWIDEVVAHTAKQTMPARFSRARGSRTPFLSRVFSRPGAGRGAGHHQAPGHRSVERRRSAEAIARGLATRRLDAEIWVAPSK